MKNSEARVVFAGAGIALFFALAAMKGSDAGAASPSPKPSITRAKKRPRSPAPESPSSTPSPAPSLLPSEQSGVLDREVPSPSPSPSPSASLDPEPSPSPYATRRPDPVTSVLHQLGSSAHARSQQTFGIAAHVSPFDLLIPMKYGASLSWVKSAETTIELEYLRGSMSSEIFGLDLFHLKDERLSLVFRSFFGNSFNLHYGATYFRASARVALTDIPSVPGVPPVAYDLWETEGFGFNAGLGNRWAITPQLAFGVDWISWAQPLKSRQKAGFPEERVNESIRDDFKWLQYFPRFAIFHVQLGYYF